MKTFLSSTATALVLATTAYADGHDSAFSDMQFDAEVNLNASDLIGMRVYATEASIENNSVAQNGETEWDDIGEINEIVLTRSGDVQSVIVGVGGFLGINEKDVAVDMDQLRFVSDGEDSDDFFLVIQASAVGVQDAPAYEYNQLTNTMADEPMEDADAEMTADAETEGETMALAPTMVERDGYADVTREELTAEDLTGARVYGPSDEDIGEVSELLLSSDGTIDRAVIDVGGFLGMGEHSVAISINDLQIMREDDGDDLRVYVDASQEALEAQPEYEG